MSVVPSGLTKCHSAISAFSYLVTNWHFPFASTISLPGFFVIRGKLADTGVGAAGTRVGTGVGEGGAGVERGVGDGVNTGVGSGVGSGVLCEAGATLATV